MKPEHHEGTQVAERFEKLATANLGGEAGREIGRF